MSENDFSGCVNINKAKSPSYRIIATNSDFFNGEIIVKFDSDKIMFTKPDIDGFVKSYKTSKDVFGRYHVKIFGDLPLGKFQFDIEESDEDCRVVYFK